MDTEDAHIEFPDLIGWLGGQPIEIEDDNRIYTGFTGFRGLNDIDIVQTAVYMVMSKL